MRIGTKEDGSDLVWEGKALFLSETKGLLSFDLFSSFLRQAIHAGEPIILHAGTESLWPALTAAKECGRQDDFLWIDRKKIFVTPSEDGITPAKVDITRSPGEPIGIRINPFLFGDMEEHLRFLDRLVLLCDHVGGVIYDRDIEACLDLTHAIFKDLVQKKGEAAKVSLLDLHTELLRDSPAKTLFKSRFDNEKRMEQSLASLGMVFLQFGAEMAKMEGDEISDAIDLRQALEQGAILAFPAGAPSSDPRLPDIMTREIIIKLLDIGDRQGTIFTGMGTWYHVHLVNPDFDLTLSGMRHVSYGYTMNNYFPEEIRSRFPIWIGASEKEFTQAQGLLFDERAGGAMKIEFTFETWPGKMGDAIDLPDMPILTPKENVPAEVE